MTHRWDPRAAPVRGLVHPVPVDPAGLAGPTRGAARGPGWRRCSNGLYVPSDTPRSVEQRVVEAAARSRTRSVVTGWAALRLHGGGFFDGLGRDGRTMLDVPVVTNGDRIRRVPGLALVRGQVVERDVVVRHGVRVSVAERALLDLARAEPDLRRVVAAVDLAMAARLSSVTRVRRWLLDQPPLRGRARLEAALDLACEGVRSPPEVALRLVWQLDAGWSRPLVNRPVLDPSGRLAGIPDLLDPVRGLVAEFDGADHRGRERHRRDVGREDAFRRLGLEVVTVVGADLHDRCLVVDRLASAAGRAGRGPRLWRLGPAPQPLDLLLDREDALRGFALGEHEAPRS